MSAPGQGDVRPYGRRAFLLLLAGGVSSFWWATKASGIFSPVTSAVSQFLGNLFPVGGWRIYTISGSMPEFDERGWSVHISQIPRCDPEQLSSYFALDLTPR